MQRIQIQRYLLRDSTTLPSNVARQKGYPLFATSVQRVRAHTFRNLWNRLDRCRKPRLIVPTYAYAF